jgi:hypothetical protein
MTGAVTPHPICLHDMYKRNFMLTTRMALSHSLFDYLYCCLWWQLKTMIRTALCSHRSWEIIHASLVPCDRVGSLNPDSRKLSSPFSLSSLRCLEWLYCELIHLSKQFISRTTTVGKISFFFSLTHFRLLPKKLSFLLDFLSTALVAGFCYKQCNSVETLKIRIFISQVFLPCVCSIYLLRPFRKALNVRQDTVSAKVGYALVFVVKVLWETAQIWRPSIRRTHE